MDPANVQTKGFMSSAGNHTKWHQECQQMNVKMGQNAANDASTW